MGHNPAWTREMIVKGLRQDCIKQNAVVEYLRRVLDEAEREQICIEDQFKSTRDMHIILTALEIVTIRMSEMTKGDRFRMSHRDLHVIIGALTLDNLPGSAGAIPEAVAAIERWAAWLAEEAPYDRPQIPVDFDALDAVRLAIWGDRPAPGPFTDITPEALVPSITWRGYRIYHAINYQDKVDGWCAEFTGTKDEAESRSLTKEFAGFTLPVTINKIARQASGRSPEPLARVNSPAGKGTGTGA